MNSIREGKQATRLSDSEKHGILSGVEDVFRFIMSDWMSISVFGSRTDLKKKGGDIDLYLKCTPIEDLNRTKRQLLLAIKKSIGDQKIDLVIDDGNQDLGAFANIIKKEKLLLWEKT